LAGHVVQRSRRSPRTQGSVHIDKLLCLLPNAYQVSNDKKQVNRARGRSNRKRSCDCTLAIQALIARPRLNCPRARRQAGLASFGMMRVSTRVREGPMDSASRFWCGVRPHTSPIWAGWQGGFHGCIDWLFHPCHRQIKRCGLALAPRLSTC
jgi:hypothetical protein